MNDNGAEPIDFDSDILDTRDVIARIDFLGSAAEDDYEGYEDDERDEARYELEALQKFRDAAAAHIPDWRHGETLVADSYFEEYAKQMADDLGAVPSDASWPLTHIDWEAAASDLQTDYTSFELDGRTFWAR
jgi:hypothetical protein